MLDRDLREQARRALDVDVPAGWLPDGTEADLGVTDLRFDERGTIVARLPLEGERRTRPRRSS